MNKKVMSNAMPENLNNLSNLDNVIEVVDEPHFGTCNCCKDRKI